MRPDPVDAPLGAGDRLPGTAYVLLRRLGTGSMGEVFEARHEPLDCLRALKLLWPQHAPGSSSAKRLRVEARALASLRHPNLVDVVDFGESAGRSFLAMTLLDGHTVGAALRRLGRLRPQTAVIIACALLDGLHAAHSVGIVHRDVKPENAFLCTDGVVKVLDFGIAKVRDGQITDQGHTVGTPRYMAPEQILGDDVDARTDVYALGVMLFEMLAGRAPFVDDEPVALSYAHVKRRAPSLVSFAPDTPSAVLDAVGRALMKRPAERFSSALAFAEALRGALPADVAGSIRELVAQSRVPEGPSVDRDAASREWSVSALTSPLDESSTVDPLLTSASGHPRAAATRTSTADTHRAVVGDGGGTAERARPAPVAPARVNGVVAGDPRPSRAPTADGSSAADPAQRAPCHGVVGRLYVAEYYVPPSHAQLTRIADEVAALKDRIGGPIQYLGIVKASAEVPNAAHREALGVFGKRINEICDTAHLVLEGDGFRNAIQRSVITAIHGLKRQRVTCHATTGQAAAQLCPILGASDVATLLRSIEQALRGEG